VEDRRIDALARLLGNETSRRGVLRTLMGAVAGGAVAAFGPRGARAKSRCRSDGDRCSRGSQCCGGACCGGVCTALYRDPRNCGACGHVCAVDEICAGENCCKAPDAVCGSDAECCGFACVNGRCCVPSGGECNNLYGCCNLFCEPQSETPGVCA
jgi:hypothetical protein